MIFIMLCGWLIVGWLSLTMSIVTGRALVRVHTLDSYSQPVKTSPLHRLPFQIWYPYIRWYEHGRWSKNLP